MFEPKPHQVNSISKFIDFKFRMLLAAPLGSGKTATALLLSKTANKKMIIFVPKRLKTQWKNQILDFNFGEEKDIFICNKKEDFIYAVKEQYRFIIAHYEIVRDLSNIDEVLNLTYKYKILKKFIKRNELRKMLCSKNIFNSAYDKIVKYEKENNTLTRFDLNSKIKEILNNLFDMKKSDYVVVLDELFKLKNYKALLNKAFTFFCSFNWFGIVGLDALPFYNKVHETRNVSNVIKENCISWEEINQFIYQTSWGEWKTRNLTKFNKLLVDRIMYRISEEEVQKYMPKLTYQKNEVENTTDAYKLKNYLMENTADIFRIYTVLRVLDSFLDIDLMKENEESIIYELLHKYELREFPFKEKLNTLNEILDQIDGKKVVIFSCFSRTVCWLYDILKKDYTVSYVTGQTPDKEFDKITENFKKGNTQILLATDSLSRGADFPLVEYLVNWDISPSNVIMKQRAGRIRRVTSTEFENPKLIINLVGDIIEKDIVEIINTKQLHASMVVDGKEETYEYSEQSLMSELAKRWGKKVVVKSAAS
jgi:superfamily II DNA or RNA helicase